MPSDLGIYERAGLYSFRLVSALLTKVAGVTVTPANADPYAKQAVRGALVSNADRLAPVNNVSDFNDEKVSPGIERIVDIVLPRGVHVGMDGADRQTLPFSQDFSIASPVG